MMKIGGKSFSQEGYKKFVSLPKETQVKQIYESLNPKDEALAIKLLKNIPNGDNISKGSTKQTESDNSNTSEGAGSSTGDARSKTDPSKGK